MSLVTTPIPVLKINDSIKKTSPIKFEEYIIDTYNSVLIKLKGNYFIPITALFNSLKPDTFFLNHQNKINGIIRRFSSFKKHEFNGEFIGFTQKPMFSDVFFYGFMMEFFGVKESFFDYISNKKFMTTFGVEMNPQSLLESYFNHGYIIEADKYKDGVTLDSYIEMILIYHQHHPLKGVKQTRLIEVPITVINEKKHSNTSALPILLRKNWEVKDYNDYKTITSLILLQTYLSPSTFDSLASSTFYYYISSRDISVTDNKMEIIPNSPKILKISVKINKDFIKTIYRAVEFEF